MATVYLAQDLRHDRRWRSRCCVPPWPQALGPERFLREIQIAARLQHPHILPLFDSGTADGLPYYAMPYIEGESLRARMTRERQLDLDEALRITREIAAALGYAHAQGIVHRDIKPENILLHRTGSALVADFGIARALAAAGRREADRDRALAGHAGLHEPGAGARETRRSTAAATSTAWAACSTRCWRASPPSPDRTAQAILARHAIDPVPSLRTVRSTVPLGLDHAISTALAKVPADRFATAGAFVRHSRQTEPRA